MFSTLAATACFLALVFFMWIALIIQSKLKSFGLSNFNSKVYDGVLFSSDNTQVEASGADKQVTPREMAMRD